MVQSPGGGSVRELQQNALTAFEDRPRAPDSCYGKGAGTCHPMKVCPWGWNRLYGEALLPFPRAERGFCGFYHRAQVLPGLFIRLHLRLF